MKQYKISDFRVRGAAVGVACSMALFAGMCPAVALADTVQYQGDAAAAQSSFAASESYSCYLQSPSEVTAGDTIHMSLTAAAKGNTPSSTGKVISGGVHLSFDPSKVQIASLSTNPSLSCEVTYDNEKGTATVYFCGGSHTSVMVAGIHFTTTATASGNPAIKITKAEVYGSNTFGDGSVDYSNSNYPLTINAASAGSVAVDEFASRLYTSILDRDGDASGLATQVNALRNGWAPAEIAYNYFNSAEYFNKHETAERTVERVYQVMFGRASDEEGKAFWVEKMRSGMSVRAVVAGFSQSDEYRQYFGSIGLSANEIPVYSSSADKSWDSKGNLVYAGGNGRDLNQGATEFAKRMYTTVLGRYSSIGYGGAIDVAGLNAQAGAIANGTACWKIALNFFDSAEYKAKNHSNAESVSIAYRAILGRSCSPSESKGWVDRMEKEHLSVSDLVKGFCQSDEFENTCQRYGLSSGMR